MLPNSRLYSQLNTFVTLNLLEVNSKKKIINEKIFLANFSNLIPIQVAKSKRLESKFSDQTFFSFDFSLFTKKALTAHPS